MNKLVITFKTKGKSWRKYNKLEFKIQCTKEKTTYLVVVSFN